MNHGSRLGLKGQGKFRLKFRSLDLRFLSKARMAHGC